MYIIVAGYAVCGNIKYFFVFSLLCITYRSVVF